MKVTGIIAEYDPFHNGHSYHIKKAREMTGADAIVVVMSGHFTPVSYTHLCLPAVSEDRRRSGYERQAAR